MHYTNKPLAWHEGSNSVFIRGAQSVDEVKSHAYPYMFITSDQVFEWLWDICTSRVFALISQEMIPVHPQELALSNLPVPDTLHSDDPPFHSMMMLGRLS